VTPLRVHLALFTVSILFSLNYIVSKLSMGFFLPMTFAWLRVVGSAIVLNLIVRGASNFTRADWRQITLLSILGVVINQALFLGGLALTSAHVAAILITCIPVFAVAAAILLGQERATAMKIGGIALAAAGALLVVGGEGVAEGAAKPVIGSVMLVLNCLSYALYLVLSKPTVMRLSPPRVIAKMFAIGTVLLLPISAPSLLRQKWDVPGTAWIGLGLVIAGPTVGAYLLNAWALRHAETSLVAAYTYVQPVLTTILASIFLQERIRPIIIGAALMIFAGVWLAGVGPQAPGPRPRAS
jgi:drug/metabolite transporter (DMT)-like permease